MPDRALSLEPLSALRIGYGPLDRAGALAPNVLAALAFGARPAPDDPRFIRVGLEPAGDAEVMELWQVQGAVHTGRVGEVRYAADADYLFGVLEIDEGVHGGLCGASEAAYASLRQFLGASAHPHVLRIWNYFDAINAGAGDQERYKQFCIGRAAGLGPWLAERYPAATVIGRRDGDPRLQVYWLAARTPGVPFDNPRQVNPHRYPRQYGPRAPQFSRAMLVESRVVLISGTASIIGHASHHPGDLDSQLEEVLNNLGSVLQQAAGLAPGVPTRLGAHTQLKFYVRDPRSAAALDAGLRLRLPAETLRLILVGDVCRADLLLEADGVHTA